MSKRPNSPGHLPILGYRLRSLRRGRGISLGEAAKATGLSPSFLSLVETGKSDLTIGRLMRVAEFYNTSVANLVEPDNATDDNLVIRADDGRHVKSPDEALDLYLLAPRHRPHEMMPLIAVLGPGGANREPACHNGEEFIYVLEGTAHVDLEGSNGIVLAAGDCMYFDATRGHSYANGGRGELRMLVVVTPPTKLDSPHRVTRKRP